MELSNYLRPDYVKRQQREYTDRLEEELFDLYKTNLGHQMVDQHKLPQMSLPVGREGLGCDDYIGEDRMAQIFEKIDSVPVADKLLQMMDKAGWHLTGYVEDGQMYITVEGANHAS
jgi:hypothetical protein